MMQFLLDWTHNLTQSMDSSSRFPTPIPNGLFCTPLGPIWNQSRFPMSVAGLQQNPSEFPHSFAHKKWTLGFKRDSRSCKTPLDLAPESVREMAMPQLFGRTKNVAKRSKKYLEEALYERLFKEGSSELSVRQQLNQFLKSSKRVYKWEVGDTINKLRDRKRYYPALKVPYPNLVSCVFSLSLLQI